MSKRILVCFGQCHSNIPCEPPGCKGASHPVHNFETILIDAEQTKHSAIVGYLRFIWPFAHSKCYYRCKANRMRGYTMVELLKHIHCVPYRDGTFLNHDWLANLSPPSLHKLCSLEMIYCLLGVSFHLST